MVRHHNQGNFYRRKCLIGSESMVADQRRGGQQQPRAHFPVIEIPCLLSCFTHSNEQKALQQRLTCSWPKEDLAWKRRWYISWAHTFHRHRHPISLSGPRPRWSFQQLKQRQETTSLATLANRRFTKQRYYYLVPELFSVHQSFSFENSCCPGTSCLPGRIMFFFLIRTQGT